MPRMPEGFDVEGFDLDTAAEVNDLLQKNYPEPAELTRAEYINYVYLQRLAEYLGKVEHYQEMEPIWATIADMYLVAEWLGIGAAISTAASAGFWVWHRLTEPEAPTATEVNRDPAGSPLPPEWVWVESDGQVEGHYLNATTGATNC